MDPEKKVILTSSVKYSLKKTKTVMAPSRIKNSLDPKNISEIFNLGTDVILLE